MTKNKLLLFVLLLIVIISLSSCGIFGKGCGCPEFGYVKGNKIQHEVCVKPQGFIMLSDSEASSAPCISPACLS